MSHNVFERNVRKPGMVRVRGGFSDTHGIKPISTTIQIDDFDDDSRVQISNRLFKTLELFMDNSSRYIINSISIQSTANGFCKDIINDVFCERNILRGGYVYNWREVYDKRIDDVIRNAEYYEVLDLTEYICHWIDKKTYKKFKQLPYDSMNTVFEQECIGYRFVNKRIVAITDGNEICAIEEASNVPFAGCRKHLEKSVGFLADRENKDYKNCIKESISAVESACQQIVGDEKATLGEALKKLEDNGVALHPSLKQGFSKLYGYTSDQGGIRHAEGLFESNVTFEEAKYMLVSCSAFVNYLIAVSGKGSN